MWNGRGQCATGAVHNHISLPFLAPVNQRKAPLLNYGRENKARHDRLHACKFGFDWNHLNLKMSNHTTCICSWLYFFSNAAYPLLNFQTESWKTVQILGKKTHASLVFMLLPVLICCWKWFAWDSMTMSVLACQWQVWSRDCQGKEAHRTVML